MSEERRGHARAAVVITASDRSAAAEREDTSGAVVAQRLEALGFRVDREVVPDDRSRIERTLIAAAARHALIVTTGGTGLTPRDVTPQATLAVIDYEVPGMAEQMRAEGRRHTPMASLSRGVVGVRGGSLIVNLPGSPKGAMESLEAILPVLDHALETLAGPFDHRQEEADSGTKTSPMPSGPASRSGSESSSESAASSASAASSGSSGPRGSTAAGESSRSVGRS
jgi:molybdenum cofactor synthesis domain-containing protein